jgi:anti-sigma B factor antagonist
MVPVSSLLVHRPRALPVLLRILVGLGSIAGCGGERQQPRSDAIVSPENAPELPRELDTENRLLRLESVDGVIVVSFRVTKILADEDGEAIDMQLTSLVEDEAYKFLLLNFSNVEFFGPPDVIGKLVRLKKRIAAVGGKLKLCCINAGMLEVLRITGIDREFEIYPDEQKALDDF